VPYTLHLSIVNAPQWDDARDATRAHEGQAMNRIIRTAALAASEGILARARFRQSGIIPNGNIMKRLTFAAAAAVFAFTSAHADTYRDVAEVAYVEADAPDGVKLGVYAACVSARVTSIFEAAARQYTQQGH